MANSFQPIGNPSTLRQIVSPRTYVKDYAGYCHRMAQAVYGAPWQAGLGSATSAANVTKWRNSSRTMPNVSVPVWFDHWGTYGGVYGNWGHVVAWVPGHGFLSSPAAGYGQGWFASLESVERTFNSKFRFWSLDINTLKVAEERQEPPTPPTPEVWQEEEDMYKPTVHYRTTGGGEWTLAHPGIGSDLEPGGTRKDGNVTTMRGFQVTSDTSIGKAWARMFARGVGNELTRTERDDYVTIQNEATRLSVELSGQFGNA